MTSPHRRFKDAIYEQFARLGTATSAPKRLELLDPLCQWPRTPLPLRAEAACRGAGLRAAERDLRPRAIEAPNDPARMDWLGRARPIGETGCGPGNAS
jgi:hypothetical protein